MLWTSKYYNHYQFVIGTNNNEQRHKEHEYKHGHVVRDHIERTFVPLDAAACANTLQRVSGPAENG